ncbi:hypothetical protein DM01DRAFT_1340963 [Hesseltinella vesiculosa]|uniref:Arrestin C-terminal-like domain-containing protein n=1 Tax=Hesseltinella vesiculosa TaxID=101127 RepID=A0A1X2G2E4_9FUNG|nr:hypothetical protein DM01DRAFT_1340963 [Hesseltinella vesiculosa]
MTTIRDGFQSVTLDPFNHVLEFVGPICARQTPLKLKGDARIHLNKTIKVKSITLKFKGMTRVCHHNSVESIDISSPILPKQKSMLLTSTTTLTSGEVILPWELDIPNIYPCSVMIKRLVIQYKVELVIAFGLNKSVKAEFPVIIKRHVLPTIYYAPSVPSKVHTQTISTKFHYEIECPRIVCSTQQTFPVAIKLVSIGGPKRVLNIRSQIIQFELYRCTNISKTEADVLKGEWATPQRTTSSQPEQPRNSKPSSNGLSARFVKRTPPALIHALDESEPMAAHQRILLRHRIHDYLFLDLKSPLASIYHQLEITFQFGSKFEDIRARVPITLISAASSQPSHVRPILDTAHSNASATSSVTVRPIPMYPFELDPDCLRPLCVTDESRLDSAGTATIITNSDSDRPGSSLTGHLSSTQTEDQRTFKPPTPSPLTSQQYKHQRSLSSGSFSSASKSYNTRSSDLDTGKSSSSSSFSHLDQRPSSSTQSDLSLPLPASYDHGKRRAPTNYEELLMDDQSEQLIASDSSSSHHTPRHSFTGVSLASRPLSPGLPPAAGLPVHTTLHPHLSHGALLEEGILPSSDSVISSDDIGSLTSSVNHPWHRYAPAMHYAQGFITNGKRPERRLSMLSVAQSSIVDPDDYIIDVIDQLQFDHDFQENQARSLEQHYKHAELPPLPMDTNLSPSTPQPLPPPRTPAPLVTNTAIDTILASSAHLRSTRHLDVSQDIQLAAAAVDELNLYDTTDDEDQWPVSSSLPPPPPRLARPSSQLPANDPQQELDPVCLCPKHGVPI